MGADRIELLRRWILGVLVLGLVGTVIELLLLAHYEQPLQFVPLVLIAAAMVVIVWQVRRRDAASLAAFKIVMVLFAVSGFVGIAAHFYGSAEFQLEIDPSIRTWDLLMKVIHAQAPPLLAPGMMLQLGLIGLAYAYSDSRYRRSELK